MGLDFGKATTAAGNTGVSEPKNEIAVVEQYDIVEDRKQMTAELVNTLPYIQAAERMKSKAEAQAILRDMHDLYEEMGNEVRQKRHEAFLETIPTHLALLRAWEKCLGMPILPTEFECIERLAHECGAVIKTAGAGGGDLLVAFARDKANIRELAKKLNALSISEIPFGIAPERDYP